MGSEWWVAGARPCSCPVLRLHFTRTGGRLQIPDGRRLAALTENQVVRDLDVTGLSLLEALHRCCERINLQFKFVPRPAETGTREAIVFYRDGAGRAVDLNV